MKTPMTAENFFCHGKPTENVVRVYKNAPRNSLDTFHMKDDISICNSTVSNKDI